MSAITFKRVSILFVAAGVATLLVFVVSCRDKGQRASRPATQPGGTVWTVPTQEIPCSPVVGGDVTGDGFYGRISGHPGAYETWIWHDGNMVKGKTFGDQPYLYDIAIVPDGRYLGQIYRKPYPKGILILGSVETGEVIREWKPSVGWEYQSIGPGLSSNGKFAAVILAEEITSNYNEKTTRHRVGRIDLTTLELTWVGELVGHGAGTIRRIAVSDDGRYIAVGGWHNGVALVDAAAQKVLWAARPPTEVSTGYVLFSSDALTLFTAGSEGCAYVIDTLTGQIKGKMWATETGQSIYGHRISCLAMSPDGQYLAAGTGPEGYVYLWKTASADSKPKVLPHGGMTVLVVSFSPNSDYLASVANGKIKVWSTTQP